MRKFTGTVVISDTPGGRANIERLEDRLSAAFTLLYGMQDRFMSEEQTIIAQNELEDIVMDMAAALAGKEIEFVKSCPEPAF